MGNPMIWAVIGLLGGKILGQMNKQPQGVDPTLLPKINDLESEIEDLEQQLDRSEEYQSPSLPPDTSREELRRMEHGHTSDVASDIHISHTRETVVETGKIHHE